MSDEDLAVRMAKESSPAHLNRQRVRFSSIALSWERRERRKRGVGGQIETACPWVGIN